LVVDLNRSDRLYALAQQARARNTLIEVMSRLRSMLRAGDRWALVSHDEIWVLLTELPSAALVELAARTLQQTLARPITTPEGVSVRLQPLIGAALLAKNTHADPMMLLQAAAGACTTARRFEDHVQILRLETDHDIADLHALGLDLQVALSGNELDVHFQPQMALAASPSGAVIGAEALVRWNCPKRGWVPPNLIASVCEERGLMPALTQFVMNTSLRHQVYWKQKGIDLKVAVNVSASSLSDSTFPIQVAQALSTWDADPSCLTIELTEGVIVENERVAIDFMQQLSDQGCRLALDDFGTGYSSFAYLRQFPLHELKIDQSFVRNLESDLSDRRIVGALVDLAHTFDLQALAEGIETPEVAQCLAQLGCDLGQGWLYSKALNATDLLAWAQQRQTCAQIQVKPCPLEHSQFPLSNPSRQTTIMGLIGQQDLLPGKCNAK
jgi:EAL domain-containing protein (putative c-di-GMP-specific phosphodiesterase class I)